MITSTLNRRITIENSVSGKDSVGAPTSTYAVLCNAWASMYIRSVDTRFLTEGSLPVSTTEWIIRNRKDVNIKCRIMYEGNCYKIISVERIGRNEGLKITTILFNE